MTDQLNFQFYCLSYYKEKRDNMKKRFEELNIDCIFYSGVEGNDKNISNKSNKCNKYKKRQLSIMYGHLNIINEFYYNNTANYAIICEDDIIIHKDINNILRKIILDFNILGLDILLLSYMIPYKISVSNIFFDYPLKKEMPLNSQFKYHDYPEYLSGTQMYMITKSYAKYIIETYCLNSYIPYDGHFIIDKLLLHHGNKALLYPMLAIENEKQEDSYHQLCHNIHYNECYI